MADILVFQTEAFGLFLNLWVYDFCMLSKLTKMFCLGRQKNWDTSPLDYCNTAQYDCSDYFNLRPHSLKFVS